MRGWARLQSAECAAGRTGAQRLRTALRASLGCCADAGWRLLKKVAVSTRSVLKRIEDTIFV